MSVNLKLKRSSVRSKVPETTALELGELAINTYDGCIYLKRNSIKGDEIVKICSTENLQKQITALFGLLASQLSVSCEYVDVQDCEFIGAGTQQIAFALNSVDSDNNTNWAFI